MIILSIEVPRVNFGPLKKNNSKNSFHINYDSPTIGLLILLYSESIIFIWTSITIMGLGMGVLHCTLSIIRNFGTKNLGQIIGVSRVGLVAPAIAGPILAGLIFDNYNNYKYLF